MIRKVFPVVSLVALGALVCGLAGGWILIFGPARTAWPTGSPADHGMSLERLEDLADTLQARGTHTFLVAKDGTLVFERYFGISGPRRRGGTAAMAKGLVAVPVFLAAVSDGLVQIDEPVRRVLPQWADDPVRRTITFAHLLSHSSGMPDVPFDRAEAITEGRVEDSELPEWMVEYFQHPDRRFRLAVDSAPIQFPPGSRFEYSGTGYYALANAMATILQPTGENAEEYFRTRLTRPLGIADADWRLSYGETHRVGGRELVALGSGADLTGRALARIGQLLLDQGLWDGSSLLRTDLVYRALSNEGIPIPANGDGDPDPGIGLGWWVNNPRVFSELPPDAVISAGAGERVVVLVPSWDLVAVRLGRRLGRSAWGGSYWRDLERDLLNPLAAAVRSGSSTK